VSSQPACIPPLRSSKASPAGALPNCGGPRCAPTYSSPVPAKVTDKVSTHGACWAKDSPVSPREATTARATACGSWGANCPQPMLSDRRASCGVGSESVTPLSAVGDTGVGCGAETHAVQRSAKSDARIGPSLTAKRYGRPGTSGPAATRKLTVISWGVEGGASSPLVEAPKAPDRRAARGSKSRQLKQKLAFKCRSRERTASAWAAAAPG